MKNADMLGFIYAVLLKLYGRDITPEEAIRLIREMISI